MAIGRKPELKRYLGASREGADSPALGFENLKMWRFENFKISL
jgi:hypothetical protein